MSIQYVGFGTVSPGDLISFTDYNIGMSPFITPGSPMSSAIRASILSLMWVVLFLTLKVPGAIPLAIMMGTFTGIGEFPGMFGADAVTDLSNWKQPGGPSNWLPIEGSLPGGHFDFSAANTPYFWEVSVFAAKSPIIVFPSSNSTRRRWFGALWSERGWS